MNRTILAALILAASFLSTACGGGDPDQEDPAVAEQSSPVAGPDSGKPVRPDCVANPERCR